MFITTQNLIIRNFRDSDFDGFFALIRDRESQPDAIYDERFPTDEYTLRRLLHIISRENEFFAVCLADGGELIGFVALVHAQDDGARNLAYCIRSDMRGHGYAYESAAAATAWAFSELGLVKISAGAAAANTTSVQLLGSLGFTKIGERSAIFSTDERDNPIYHDGIFFELTRDGFESARSARNTN